MFLLLELINTASECLTFKFEKGKKKAIALSKLNRFLMIFLDPIPLERLPSHKSNDSAISKKCSNYQSI